MSVKLEQLRAGQMLYDVRSLRAGKSSETRTACWPVKVIEVDLARAEVVISYNGGSPARWTRRQVERLFRQQPGAKPTRRRR